MPQTLPATEYDAEAFHRPVSPPLSLIVPRTMPLL